MSAPVTSAAAAAPAAPAAASDLRRYLESPPPAIPTLLDVSGIADSDKSVLIIQHGARVPPGYLAYFLMLQRTPFHVLTLDQSGAVLPPVEQPWLAIVSLGGPQGAYEEDLHPWIALEKVFLVAHIGRNTPVLGICLGCQMLAMALGGHGYAAPKEAFEVGYVPVRLTAEGAKDELMTKLFSRLEAVTASHQQEEAACAAAAHEPAPVSCATGFSAAAAAWRKELGTASTTGFLMHHGDTFDLPASVPVLATSMAGFKQIFRAGSALAVQCHPEAGLHEISGWTSWNPARYLLIGTTKDEVVQQVQLRQQEAREHSRIFFEVWWESLGFTVRREEDQAQVKSS
jgi:GMP synthase-like glutamine amidotransferase